jgi:uncharacterized protein
MESAKAARDEATAEPLSVDPPTIGVPRIPAQVGPSWSPRPVPALPVSDDRSTPAPVLLAPVGPAPSPVPPVTVPSTGPVSSPGSVGFAPGVADKLASYVYLLVDPRTGRAFYVGKGRNDRCFRHLAAAQPGVAAHRKFPMLEQIRAIESAGRSVRIDILRYGLSPTEASTVEAAVRDALGLSTEVTLGSQRRTAIDLNAALAERARFKRGHQVVLLAVGGTGTEWTYESARHGWRIARRFTDLDAARAPKWAAIVAANLVAAVYRIEGWEDDRPGRRPDDSSAVRPGPGDRYSFFGRRDPELEKRYRGRSVSGYVGGFASNPLTYVGCGPHGGPYPADHLPLPR